VTKGYTVVICQQSYLTLLSIIISKLFESVLLRLYDSFLTSDSLQYGFKKNNSCTQSWFTVNESVRYFTKRGSLKFTVLFLMLPRPLIKSCTMEFIKKLLDRGVPDTLVRLLQYWYGNLQCRVMWNNVLGESLSVLCGVRQGGGVLSPVLFSLYIDDLIAHL